MINSSGYTELLSEDIKFQIFHVYKNRIELKYIHPGKAEASIECCNLRLSQKNRIGLPCMRLTYVQGILV